MADNNIALELCRASQMWPEPGEPIDDFLDRLVPAVNALTEDEFMGMPEEAQRWADDAIDHKNNDLPYPDLDGFDDVPMNGEEKPAARVAKPDIDPEITAKKAKGKGKRAAKTPGERKSRQLSGNGIVAVIGQALIDNPDATVDDIRKTLTRKGLSASQSSVPTFRSAFRNFLSVLKKHGHTDLTITY